MFGPATFGSSLSGSDCGSIRKAKFETNTKFGSGKHLALFGHFTVDLIDCATVRGGHSHGGEMLMPWVKR